MFRTREAGLVLSIYAGEYMHVVTWYPSDCWNSELIECSQDQWDIYKLDPVYDCYVRKVPETTVITRNTSKPETASPSPVKRFNKRSMSPLAATMGPSPRKKTHTETSELSLDTDEQQEREEIVIDSRTSPQRAKSSGPREKARKFKEQMQRNRKERREKLARRAEKLGRDGMEFTFDYSEGGHFHSRSEPPECINKRKGV